MKVKISFSILAILLLPIVSCTPSSDQAKHQYAPPARVTLPDNEISAIAQREIVRRQSRIKSADEAAYRAAQQSSAGNNEAAIEEYSRALKTLPATR